MRIVNPVFLDGLRISMNIHFLGTSSGNPSKYRNVSATAVQFERYKTWLLVDCGDGTQQKILQAGLPLYHLNAIFITHTHGDHCFGLPGLLSSVSIAGRKLPLLLLAPQSVIDFVLHALRLTEVELGFELQLKAWEPLLESAQALQLEQCRVTLHPLQHRTASVAFKISESHVPIRVFSAKLRQQGIPRGPHLALLQQGLDAAYAGQTLLASDYSYLCWRPRQVVIAGDNENPNLLKSACAKVDVLVHEATFISADLQRITKATGHSCAKRIAEFAERLGIPHLVLFHFSARYHGRGMLAPLESEAKTYYHGQLTLADDGLSLHIEKQFAVTESKKTRHP
ncbi:ribonuclease Z [Pseudoalteromonas tunicata]|nr:ribonuclease Z [Pseudoalteromonas tunicata]